MRNFIFLLLALAFGGQLSLAQGVVQDAFQKGQTSGKLRFYRNDRDLPHAQNTADTSAGGSIHYQTDPSQILRGGFTFYSANNMGFNSSDPNKVNPLLPSANIDILGEAYLQLAMDNTTVTAGRQLFNSPFANPSDAFMIPVTFEGFSLVNKTFKHITIQVAQLNQIKNRQSPDFVNTGLFITQRYLGTSKGQETRGTTVADIEWNDPCMMAEVADYDFADIFNMWFVQAGYHFNPGQNLNPYLQAQYLSQNDIGSKLLGSIRSQLLGVKAGLQWGRLDFSLGYTSSPGSAGNYLNGGPLGPFTFFTEPIYTNSMLSGPTNTEAGNAYKAKLLYAPTDAFHIKLSYADFNLNNYKQVAGGVNQKETDLWLAYYFSGAWKGFSAKLRMAQVLADQDTKSVTEYRSQLQYLF